MRRKEKNPGTVKHLRCAIYCRVSSDERLDQSFNSLHAQRESCEAYVLSQAGEGWVLVPTAYEDGGFSGGNMQRPGLIQLLADVDAGKIDVVLTYKVDRLSRSLMDIASIVERLDATNTSFVSVTQSFNTSSSMGRLTLNVLLSFAQFEREVTGERIRDKLRMSRAKGMFMGGNIALGYDLYERRLIVNESEAATVRHMFERYLALGSVPGLAKELHASGIRSKRRTTQGGREIGGARIRLGALYHLLQNRLYLGEIVDRDQIHDGEHESIVSRDLFEQVEMKLADNRRQHRDRPVRAASCPLTGLIQDAEGVPMSPSFGYGRSRRFYRYYVSASLLPGRGPEPKRHGIIRRVPAPQVEALVVTRAAVLLQRREAMGWEELGTILKRVEIRDTSIHLLFDSAPFVEPHEPASAAIARLQERIGIADQLAIDADDLIRLVCDGRPVFRGGRVWRRDSDGVTRANRGSDPALATLLKSAHAMLSRYQASPLDLASHVDAEAPVNQRDRRLMSLGMLAPDIQKAILERKVPVGLTANKLLAADVPIAWADQRRLFGFVD